MSVTYSKWAERHELPASQKVSHAHVHYQNHEHEGSDGEQGCDDCKNYIAKQPPRCRTVRGPIDEEGWCVRFVRIRPEEPEEHENSRRHGKEY